MRALLSFIVLIAIGIASSQRNRFQNFGNSGRQRFPGLPVSPTNPLNSGSGISAQINSPTPVGPRGCFCLPENQLCVPNGGIPIDATRISNLKTRIVNTDPLSNCPQGQSECCYGSIGGPPTPHGPIPTPILGCGARQSIKPGNAAKAEADFGEYPWVAAILGQGNKFVAAGALVSPQWVLTVAHKITSPQSLRVRVGDYNLAVPNEFPEFPHQEANVVQVVFHPSFNPTNLKNDVALLRLETPVKLDKHINLACIPEKFQTFYGQRCWVSGWGENADRSFQPILREVDLPIIEEFSCEEQFRRTRLGNTFTLDKEAFLCAGGERGKDACRGDGGAPLVCDENGIFTVVGLVAWGIGCGQNQVPGAYVNIATYSDFIKSHVST